MSVMAKTTSDRIEIGDKVSVQFWQWVNDVQGVVKYVPQSPSDAWIIAGYDGSLRYVQHFAVITRDGPPDGDIPF